MWNHFEKLDQSHLENLEQKDPHALIDIAIAIEWN